MKKFLFAIILIFLMVPVGAAGLFDHLFTFSPVADSAHYEFKPIATVCIMRLMASRKADRLLEDPEYPYVAGGGLTLQKVVKKDDKNFSQYSFTAAIFKDLSIAAFFGLQNNVILIGPIIKMGKVSSEESRFGIMINSGFTIF